MAAMTDRERRKLVSTIIEEMESVAMGLAGMSDRPAAAMPISDWAQRLKPFTAPDDAGDIDELMNIRDRIISIINTPRSTLRDTREAVRALDRVVPEIRRDLWPVVNRLAAIIVARRAR